MCRPCLPQWNAAGKRSGTRSAWTELNASLFHCLFPSPSQILPRKSRWQLQLPNAVFRRPWRRHGSSTWHGTTNRPNGPEIAIIRLKATAVVCCRSASVFIETDLTKKFLEEMYYSLSTMDPAFKRTYMILVYETHLTKRRNVRVSMFPSRRSESVMRQGAIHIH